MFGVNMKEDEFNLLYQYCDRSTDKAIAGSLLVAESMNPVPPWCYRLLLRFRLLLGSFSLAIQGLGVWKLMQKGMRQ
ncbi:putative Transcriptional regulator-like protein [Crenothrix polyspora]|uniref:Putative Transcriptional regulator-like protein n=1 Tax=Crenothrix polyspora TaxID=360316 RepID=A0A1R4H1N4_9GAMM|nr:putative Transcriptional regulator-like protein [Crenothrix polyspora]